MTRPGRQTGAISHTLLFRVSGFALLIASKYRTYNHRQHQSHPVHTSHSMRTGTRILYLTVAESIANAWMNLPCSPTPLLRHRVLSSNYLENDLVAVQKPDGVSSPRLCVVRPDNTVAPLCRHEDDVETDLYLDPRCDPDTFWV